MSDQVMTVTVKGIGDFSDVVSNVGSVQKALTKLKLPDKLGDSLSKNITAFYKEYEKYQKKITEGVKTQGDYNQVEKSLNNMRSLYQAIGKDAQKLTQLDMKDMLNLDTGEFKKIMGELTSVVKQIGSVKIDTAPFNKAFADIRNITKNSKITGDNGLLNQIIGSVNTGQIAQAKKQLQELENYAKKVAPRTTESGARMPGTLSTEKYRQLTAAIDIMNKSVSQAEVAMNPLIEKQNDLQRELDETKQKAAQGIKNEFDGYNQASDQVENLTESLKRMHQEEFSFNREAQNIDRQIQSYFGLSQMIRKVGDIAKDAFATVKELDKAMTETAVVTNFSVGDMWEMLPTYTAQANQLGSTIKDVYDAATLYYQQGLNTNQAMSLANETLKMARIAGLDAADATNMMTAALRGFNMEINQQSAQKINDIYSELAAITASDTKEIGSAMERTASIANSANMEFATTSAFLAQMIETTREAPENLGTAMKTIVARFQEMKKDPTKLIDSEGVAMDANKVDTALKSIGVQLMNTKGEFRDLDDVFLDIASKWDSLSQGQQRYIATIAAGSRQQSRFIAMMSNYERTMELVDAANNSAGASQRQFEKTLDSMEAKLNMLKNAWDQFTMGLMNNQILKFGVDALTEGFTIVNKFIDILGKIPPKPFEGVTQSILTLVTTLGMLNFGKKASRSLVMGGISWWQNGKLDKEGNPIEGGFFKGAAEGWGSPSKGGLTKTLATINTNSIGYRKGQELANGLKKGFKANNPAKEVEANLQSIKPNKPKVVMSAADIEAEYHRVIQAQLGHSPEIANATKEEVSGYIKQIKQGKMTPEQLYNKAPMLGIAQESLDPKVKEVTQLSDAFEQLGGKVSLAGSTLVDFGAGLGGPVGSALTTVGSLLMTVGNGLTLFATESVFATAATEALGTASWFSLAGINALGAGVQALWAKFLASPLAPIIVAIAAIAGIAYGIYRVATADARALEAANDAAAAASEAYDSAKQETSELADSITKIQETDSAFDGLVAGTAEFNEQLVTANEQIMALIDKYPMLLDASKNYVTTDDNGLMHISEAGFKAVKEYQKQIQANASAMNLIQTADLNALEHQQKADALRKKVNGSRRGEMTEAEAKEHEKNLREADMLDQRADAEVKLARSNAIRTALASKEIRDVDSLTSIYTNLYDTKRKAAELEVGGLGSHDIRQRYADYHGYTYDRSTKKITDVEGNEVDYDDKAIKDEVIEQTVLLDFEANASTLEGVLNEVDAKFADTLDSTSERSSHFISDVLANNINTDEDILEKALSGNDFQDAVNSMTEKEMAAILGINAESINEQNIDAKRDEIVDLLTNNATKIAEAQSKSYEDLATMMAQSKGWDTFDAEQKASQDIIRKEIQDLTAEQAHMMSDIGSQLKEGAGMEAMQIYMNRMSDLYKNINESGKQSDKDAAKEIEDIFNSVDLTSATGRLEAYTKMADSASDKVRELGEDMRASAGEANLLGQTFDEFLGGDWLELAENADDFKNSLGQIDAAGILKASEQSHTLKTMLDSGETSASGLALALQGVEDGKFSIGAVNDSVLQLLSSLNRVEDEALKAHDLIANFDAGIDYSEAAEFAQDNAKKVQEYWDAGKYGNQQLQNYIKLAAGQERWNKALRDSGGDYEQAEKSLLKYVTTFKDGFGPVIDQLVSGKGINGKALTQNLEDAVKNGNIDEALYNKFKDVVPRFEGEDFIFGTEGSRATDLTTNELKTYLEQVYGVSTEYAQLILEEWTNLSPNLAAELSKNDLMEAVGTESFKESHGTNASGQTILTNQEIDILRQAGGEEALEKVAVELGYAATEQKSAAQVMEDASFKVLDENGNRIDNTQDHGALLQDYIKTFNMAEKGSIESLFKTGAEKLFTSGTLDLSKLIQDTQAHGFDQQQAMQAAWQTYQRGEQLGERTSYDGVLLDKGIATYEEFTASIESALEASKWEAIGQSIAQGIINFINGKDPGEKEAEKSANTSEKDAASARTSREVQTEIANKQADAIKGFFNKITTSLTANSERAQQGREQKTFGGMAQPTQAAQPKESKSQASEQAAATLQEASSKISSSATNLTDAGSNLTKAGTDLSGAATKLAGAALALKTSGTTKKTSASSSNSGGGGSKSSSSNVKINYTQGTLPTVKNTSAKLNYILGTQAKPKNQTAKVNYTLGTQEKPKDKTAKVNYNKAATGQNNYIPYRSPLQLGSLARGTRYGKLGPKGKGGLTLTGEKGFEIAWLPSESRSMILGVDGPQMINLPSDAVVYTHEQSEDILRKRQEIEAGSHFKIKKGGGGGGSKKSKKKTSSKSKKSTKKDTTSAINNWSIEEVVRFDIDKKLETLASKIKKATDDIDKKLSKIGLKASGIAKDTQAQAKNLQAVKNYNNNLAASYQKDLNKLAGGPYKTQISYSTGSGKKSKSKEETVNLASYIYRDGNGDYQIDRNAIARAGSVAKQEAIFKAAESALNPLVSGLQKAKDAAADAQKQMDELGKKVSETFYQWENEITEVYDLTQRISHDESLRARFSSQVALQLSKLKAGFGDTAQSINIMHQALERDNKVLLEQIENQQKMIGARQRELNAALSAQDEFDELNRLRAKAYDTTATKNATIEWATDNYEGARLGRNYLNNVRQDRDGSLRYDIDWERFNKDRQADPYNKNTYEAIKKYLDELNSATDEFNKSIQEQTNLIKETYDALREYQDYVADFEDTLLKGYEEEIKSNIENSKKISESISNALKDLLDQVKSKLDERRQQEDNRKTEDDISRKQQRLAMLRADTSGGHQVEIAQLEKEISEAQTDYQRSLEDQLLDKLQQQADEASKQRERQIEIAQAQLEVATSGNNAIVDMWLRDPEAYKEEIKKAWLEAQGYDEKGEAGQYILASQFESEFANLVTAIDQSGFSNGFKAVSNDTNTLVSLLAQLTEGRDALTDSLSKAAGALQDVENRDTQSFELGKRAQQSAAQWKQEGFNASSLKNWGYTFDELKNSGFSNTELRDAGFGIKDFTSHGTTSPRELHDLGFKAKEITDELGLQLKDLVADSDLWQAIPWSEVSKGNYSIDDYVNAGIKDAASLKKAGFTLSDLKSNSAVWSGNSWKAIKNAGYSAADYKNAGLSYSNAIASGFTDQQLYSYFSEAKTKIDNANKAAANKTAYNNAIKTAHQKKTVTKTTLKDAINKGAAYGVGKSAYQVSVDLAAGDGSGGVTWKEVMAALKSLGYSGKTVKSWNPRATTSSAFYKAFVNKYGKWSKFSTGGLADYTGPAWLDGTPSKPELVLNAADTKNFLALRDVLSSAMKSTSAVTNSYGGDVMYDINIHVDKIEKDYDVDRVVDKVKKEITKGAGYRNVTQVRNFK